MPGGRPSRRLALLQIRIDQGNLRPLLKPSITARLSVRYLIWTSCACQPSACLRYTTGFPSFWKAPGAQREGIVHIGGADRDARGHAGIQHLAFRIKLEGSIEAPGRERLEIVQIGVKRRRRACGQRQYLMVPVKFFSGCESTRALIGCPALRLPRSFSVTLDWISIWSTFWICAIVRPGTPGRPAGTPEFPYRWKSRCLRCLTSETQGSVRGLQPRRSGLQNHVVDVLLCQLHAIVARMRDPICTARSAWSELARDLMSSAAVRACVWPLPGRSRFSWPRSRPTARSPSP